MILLARLFRGSLRPAIAIVWYRVSSFSLLPGPGQNKKALPHHWDKTFILRYHPSCVKNYASQCNVLTYAPRITHGSASPLTNEKFCSSVCPHESIHTGIRCRNSTLCGSLLQAEACLATLRSYYSQSSV